MSSIFSTNRCKNCKNPIRAEKEGDYFHTEEMKLACARELLKKMLTTSASMKGVILTMMLFCFVIPVYALQPQDDDNIQMHGIDAYGGAYGCTGYMCNLIHKQDFAQSATIPTPPTSSQQIESPVSTSMSIIPPTVPNLYAVIFGDSNPTYSNMVNYERVTVIGKSAYTMGASSDYYVRLNKIPLVSADTDQNTYIQIHGLNLVCCGDQAFSNMVNSGQGITWCQQFDGSDYCSFCDINPTSSYCQSYTYADYLDFCTKNPSDNRCLPAAFQGGDTQPIQQGHQQGRQGEQQEENSTSQQLLLEEEQFTYKKEQLEYNSQNNEYVTIMLGIIGIIIALFSSIFGWKVFGVQLSRPKVVKKVEPDDVIEVLKENKKAARRILDNIIRNPDLRPFAETFTQEFDKARKTFPLGFEDDTK